MHAKPSLIIVLVVFFCALLVAAPVMAATGITIDGNFDDWVGKATYLDTGGPDDETSPARADITEFRADADTGGLFLLQAWDDTAFTGGNATTAGITVRNPAGNYFRIYTTASGNPGAVDLSTLDIDTCTDSTCSKQADLCNGIGCLNALAASGVTMPDPWAGRPSPDCTGTNCGCKDTAVELYIPWALIGGAPTNGQTFFLQYGSYPSGPAQAPKDTLGPNGITCKNANGELHCYPATPTVIHLADFRAASEAMSWPTLAGVLGLLVAAGLAGLRLALRRQ